MNEWMNGDEEEEESKDYEEEEEERIACAYDKYKYV